jgi:alpha/beta superfamily hydrolase
MIRPFICFGRIFFDIHRMKKIVFCILFLPAFSYGQFIQYCGTPRYDTEVFSSVDITSDVIYGSNSVAGGGPTDLTLDIYQPANDTATIRPLIVWAHGGSFIAGTKNDVDVTSLCEHFAKRGYVCASINYRLGFATFPPNGGEAKRAVFRAVQDMKAAIRYFRQDAATANTYKIDPNLIFAGGSSAGAFTALHLAYLDEPSELPADIDTTVMGGMEGNSGNPGYSSQVNAIINLCGALGDKTWIKSVDEPVVSMHGTNDNTVPYATDTIIFLGFIPIMQVDGSYSISAYANSIGLMNDMYTFYGADHVPYAASLAYMDTTVRFVSNFLYRYMGCIPSDPFPLANTFVTSVNEISNTISPVYPNPSQGTIHFSDDVRSVKIFDATGRMIYSGIHPGEVHLNVNDGIYFYSVDKGSVQTGKILVQSN